MSAEAFKLGYASGTAIYQKGERLYFMQKPSQWIPVTLYVLILLTFILCVNGSLLAIMRSSSPVGYILLGTGMLLGFAAWRVGGRLRKVNTLPFEDLKCICVFDLGQGKLLNAKEEPVASLSEVKLVRKIQITSSSPALYAVWNTGSLILVKGNPFSNGVKPAERILKEKGIGR